MEGKMLSPILAEYQHFFLISRFSYRISLSLRLSGQVSRGQDGVLGTCAFSVVCWQVTFSRASQCLLMQVLSHPYICLDPCKTWSHQLASLRQTKVSHEWLADGQTQLSTPLSPCCYFVSHFLYHFWIWLPPSLLPLVSCSRVPHIHFCFFCSLPIPWTHLLLHPPQRTHWHICTVQVVVHTQQDDTG